MNRALFLMVFLLSLMTGPVRASMDRGIDVMLTERRTALVVGNAAYEKQPLKNPGNDARAMAEALDELGFEVTLVLDADHKAFRKAILDFGANLRESGGVGLFYYAGHGIQVDGRNYLIPSGASIDTEADVTVEGVDVDLLLARMGQAANRLNIVILDACRNNPFAGATRSLRAVGSGLASVQAPTGTLIAYATAPGAVAADGDGANGLYTSQLIEAVRVPGLKIEDVFKRVRAQVHKLSSGRQVPWESSSLVGDFYFAFPTGPASVQAVLGDIGTPAEAAAERRTVLWTTALLAKPDADAEPRGRVERGAIVEVLGRAEEGSWAQVRAEDGEAGYIFAKLLSDPIREEPAEPATAAAPGPGPGEADETELTFWRSIMNSRDPGDFAAYLSAYPNGRFVALARRRVAAVTVPSGVPPQTAIAWPSQGTQNPLPTGGGMSLPGTGGPDPRHVAGILGQLRVLTNSQGSIGPLAVLAGSQRILSANAAIVGQCRSVQHRPDCRDLVGAADTAARSSAMVQSLGALQRSRRRR